MMSTFSVLTKLSSRINDVVAGEKLRVTPRAATRYKAGAVDPDRAIVEPTGIYREGVSRTRISDNVSGRDFDRAMMTPKITISIERAALGPDEYRAGDIITRLEMPGEPQFEISAADPVDDGRIAFTVVAVSS